MTLLVAFCCSDFQSFSRVLSLFRHSVDDNLCVFFLFIGPLIPVRGQKFYQFSTQHVGC